MKLMPTSSAGVQWKSCHLSPSTSLDSLRAGDVITGQWTGSTLVQVMAWHRTGAKPLPEPMLTYFLRITIQWNLNQNMIIFCQENAFENIVCKMSAILYRAQCIIAEHQQIRSHIPRRRSYHSMFHIIIYKHDVHRCDQLAYPHFLVTRHAKKMEDKNKWWQTVKLFLLPYFFSSIINSHLCDIRN